MSVPLFVGLGFGKCATTWLTMRLRQHPDVYVPPINELRFWNHYQGSQTLPSQGLFLKGNARRLAKATKGPRAHAIIDRLTYWRDYHSVTADGYASYLKLFERGRDVKLMGEISPQYFALEPETLQLIARADDRTRVFLLMREPIACLWSHLRHHARRRPKVMASPDAMREFLGRDLLRPQVDYADLIQRASQAFGKERVGFFFFEDLVEDQEAYLRSICDFLGISFVPSLVQQKERKPGGSGKMPPEVERYAREHYGDVARRVEALVGRVPEKWLK